MFTGHFSRRERGCDRPVDVDNDFVSEEELLLEMEGLSVPTCPTNGGLPMIRTQEIDLGHSLAWSVRQS